jgi:hypothetical protein
MKESLGSVSRDMLNTSDSDPSQQLDPVSSLDLGFLICQKINFNLKNEENPVVSFTL